MNNTTTTTTTNTPPRIDHDRAARFYWVEAHDLLLRAMMNWEKSAHYVKKAAIYARKAQRHERAAWPAYTADYAPAPERAATAGRLIPTEQAARAKQALNETLGAALAARWTA